MRRREFITLVGGAAAWPAAARAQRPGVDRRIGLLMNGVATAPLDQSYLAAFIQGLRQLGWTEGQNLRVDVRWYATDAGLARIYAAQLIGLMPDLILAAGTPGLTAVQQATNTIPVVFVLVTDPVAQGFVASVRQPGGNVTGFSSYESSIGGKWLDLLKEVAPGVARVAVMINPDTAPQSKFYISAIEAAAASLGVQVIATPVRAAADIEPALESFARQPNGGLMVPTDIFMRLHEKLIADLAGRYRLPSIAEQNNFAKGGGLMDYGANIDYVGQFGQAASYADRILKGSKPGDLPVQAPTKYRLVINLKTAKALGITIPETLLATADEVIQ
jgi:putative tryptophan/tyrosine transport system substrate-binding protein